MLRKIAAITCAVAMSLYGASGYAEDQGVNLFVGPGFFIFNDDDLSNTESVNLGLGYRFSERWGLEGLYSKLNDTEFDTGNGDVDVDVDAFAASLMYFFEGTDQFEPYLAFGAGRADFDFAGGLGGDEDTAYHAGIGARRFFTERLSMRTDFRFMHYADASENGGAFMLGLDYLFGRSAAPAPVREKTTAPADSDGDGVYDNVDQCPDTPSGMAVDATGCPRDNDRDGVADYQDQCPDTPAGARVDEKGCQYVIKETVSVELEVLFDTNKAEVKQGFFAEVKRVADFMTLFPATKAVIEGHTDSTGADAYNQKLSQRRADAVRNVLINEHGIAPERITATGYGETRLRASDDTAAGRASNRRVVAVIQTEVEKTAP